MSEVEIVGDDGEAPTKATLQVDAWQYFPSIVYSIKNTEFIKDVGTISKEYIKNIKKTSKLDEIYPVYQTRNMSSDDRISDFLNFIGQMSVDLLDSQGYDMENFKVTIPEMWAQEHHRFSGQEEHVHPGSHLSGFYFLDVPKNSPKLVIHDPRPAKVFSNLPESDDTQATPASSMINFTPEPGTFMFINSWLPHSFTKNPSNEFFRFIHFNVTAVYDTPDETLRGVITIA